MDSGIRCVRALSLVSRVRAGAGAVGGVMCGTCSPSGVASAARVSWLSRGGTLQLGDVWLCLLDVVQNAEEASLDAGHVLFCEVGVFFGGSVWARPQQGHEAGCNHVRAELQGGQARRGGTHAVCPPPPFCLGRSVTSHIHSSAGISQVRVVHSARQYNVLQRSWLRLQMESSVSRDLRSHVPQMWGPSGSSSLVYVSGPGLCGGGGHSPRGGGSRCRVRPRCRLLRGSGRWRGCSVCCT